MRWVSITFESLATGILAVVVSFVVLIAALNIYARYVLGLGSNVGWDPVSLFGQHWKLTIIGIPVGIFLFGCSVGFWFFSQRLHR